MTQKKLLGIMCKKMSNEKPFSTRPDICTAICLATAQSICWGKEGVTLIELGVHRGSGLNFIVEVAKYLTNSTGVKYHIYGFDSFEGLPKLEGFEDHNEIWREGQYKSIITYDEMVEQFEDRAILVKGDVKDTVKEFLEEKLDVEYPIGFISLDLDLYSSSKSGLRILEDKNPNKYVPAVSMIVDDQDYLITYNDWCGEALAIREFNKHNKFRKIQDRREIYQRLRFVHILDHDLRTGKEKPKNPLKINFRSFVEFNERAMI